MRSNTIDENCHAWVLVKLGDAEDYKDSVTKRGTSGSGVGNLSA